MLTDVRLVESAVVPAAKIISINKATQAGLERNQNGQPVNVIAGQDNSGTAEGEDRANITGSPLTGNESGQQNSHAQYLSPNSFAVPAPATYGNLGRNQVVGPGFGDVDLSPIKNFPIYKERVRAQFRAEMFNVFNRINLAPPVNNLGAGPAFGASTTTIGVSVGAPGIGSGEPYNTQLALKILFWGALKPTQRAGPLRPARCRLWSHLGN
jgi:hypothetical protein